MYGGRPLEFPTVNGRVADVAQQDDPQGRATVWGPCDSYMLIHSCSERRPCDFNVTSIPRTPTPGWARGRTLPSAVGPTSFSRHKV